MGEKYTERDQERYKGKRLQNKGQERRTPGSCDTEGGNLWQREIVTSRSEKENDKRTTFGESSLKRREGRECRRVNRQRDNASGIDGV